MIWAPCRDQHESYKKWRRCLIGWCFYLRQSWLHLNYVFSASQELLVPGGILIWPGRGLMKDELCFICNVHFVLSRRCLQTNLSAVLTRGWRPELGIWKVFVFSQQELDPRIKQHQHGLMWPEKIFDMDEVSSERRLPTCSRQQYFVCEQNGSGLIWSLLSNRDEPSAIIQLFSIDPRP